MSAVLDQLCGAAGLLKRVVIYRPDAHAHERLSIVPDPRDLPRGMADVRRLTLAAEVAAVPRSGSIPDRILRALRGGCLSIGALAKNIEAATGPTSVACQRLVARGYLKQVSWGVYALATGAS